MMSQQRNKRRLLTSLDQGIRAYVQILIEHDIETVQSCQGGDGHAYELPTVDLVGGPGAGYHALGVALNFGLPVFELRYSLSVDNGRIDRPVWSLVFREQADTWDANQATSFVARELIARKRRAKR